MTAPISTRAATQTDLHTRMSQWNKSGFSLVELVIVMLIIAILAAVAATRVFALTNDAARSQLATESRKLIQTAQIFKQSTGEWPEPNKPGIVPDALRPVLGTDRFPSPPLPDARWWWVGPATGHKRHGMALQLHAKTEDLAIYKQLEVSIDDSDPDNGWLRRFDHGGEVHWFFAAE